MAGGDGRGDDKSAVAGADARMKVFISYSRRDVSFADELELALSDRGFDVLVDRHDIDAGEQWKSRLTDLIFACDTVVFVLSEASAASPTCAWEVEEAARVGKRLLVVTPAAVPGTVATPAALAGLNWIHCWRNPDIPGSSFMRGVIDLERALKMDIGWLRMQTQLQEQAARWIARGASADSPLLLRGDLLAEAHGHAARPPEGVTVSADVARFLAESEAHEARVKSEAAAGLAEREHALKAAETASKEREEAVKSAERAQKRVKLMGRLAIVIGVVLVALAIPLNYFAVVRSLEANDLRAAQYAGAANQLSEDDDHAKALLMAVVGDPEADFGLLERLLRPEGNVPARFALTRAYTGVKLLKSTRHEGQMASFSASKDGSVFAMATTVGVQLWRAEEMAPYRTINDEQLVARVAVSPDGTQLATAACSGLVKLWPMEGDRAPEVLDEGSGEDDITRCVIVGLAFDYLGERLISWDIEGKFAVWQLNAEARNRVEVSTGDVALVAGGFVSEVGANDDDSAGPGYVVADENGKVSLFKEGESTAHRSFELDEGMAPSTTLFGDLFPEICYAVGSREIRCRGMGKDDKPNVELKTDGEGEITSIGQAVGGYFLTTTGGKARVHTGLTTNTYGGPGAMVAAKAIRKPDGKTIFMTLGADGSIHYWRMDAGPGVTQEKDVLPEDANAPAQGYAFADAAVMDLQLGQKITEVALMKKDQEAPVQTLKVNGKITLWTISEDGKFAALASELGELGVWRIGQEAPAAMFRVPRLEGVEHIAFSPKEGQLITGSQGGKLRLWEIGTPEPVRVFEGHGIFGIIGSAFSADGEEFVTSGGDKTIRLWRTDSPAPLHVFRTDGYALRMAFDETGGRILAELDNGGDLALYDRRSESPVQVFQGVGLSDDRGFKDEKTITVEELQDRWTMTVDPIVFESAMKQKQLACGRLWEIGMREFSGDDYQRFPFLDRKAKHPCQSMWDEKDAAAKP